jgi:hypothetical protein
VTRAVARPEAAGPPRVRPIIFSDPMVRAILAGAKTQTRRVLKLPRWLAKHAYDLDLAHADPGLGGGGYLKVPHCHPDDVAREPDPKTWPVERVRCPHGEVTDRLCVKEAVRWNKWERRAFYVADGAPSVITGWPWKTPKLSAIYLPRGASRITLEIVKVRVERLDDISEEDAIAEGVRKLADGLFEIDGAHFASARTAFHFAWDGINGKRAPSESNPWVWCITFRRVHTSPQQGDRR